MSNDFETELKQGFLEEAALLLSNAEQCFLSLETQPNDPATLENIFRIAHNIKGSSKAVGFDALGAFTHEFESFLLKCKSGQITLTPETISLLLKCNDHVNQWVNALKADLSASLPNDELIAEIQNFNASVSAPQVEAVPEPTPEPAPMAEPEPVVAEAAPAPAPAQAQAPDPTPVAVAPTPAPAPAAAPKQAPAGAATEESIRVSLSKLEKLLNYVGELVILQAVLKEQSYSDNPALLRKAVHQVGKVTKEVQDISMGLRMVPIKQTFQKMQRIVRDTSTALGKKVRLTLQGEETEVDKTIIESLSDPLVHLIRNAVDHGIESPEARVAAGKSDTGHVVLSAKHHAGQLLIEILDDGAGINADRLRAKAREKGILSATATLSDKDAYNLIFHPGFSTKEVVTDVSGRGVGMDVVKTNIEKLQGEVQIETKLGKGTCFRVRLPLTLAIIDGMIVRSRDQRYVIPLSHVHESLRPAAKDVHFVSGLGEILSLRGENMPLYRLDTMLNSKGPQLPLNESTAIVVRSEKKAFSVLVDDIIGQSQIVIKKLSEEHRDLTMVSGSAILGDGRPALILELGELVKKYKPQAARRATS